MTPNSPFYAVPHLRIVYSTNLIISHKKKYLKNNFFFQFHNTSSHHFFFFLIWEHENNIVFHFRAIHQNSLIFLPVMKLSVQAFFSLLFLEFVSIFNTMHNFILYLSIFYICLYYSARSLIQLFSLFFHYSYHSVIIP